MVIEMQGLMQLQHKAIAAFDPEGLIFAAGVNSEHIKLYDLRSYDKVTSIVLKFNSLTDEHGIGCRILSS